MLPIPSGLLAIAGSFIAWSIRWVKRKYRQFIGDSTAAIRSRVFRESCHRYRFTKREIEIIEWQRERLTHTKIGEKLFISPATIRKHVESIYIKANVHSKTELLYEMEFKYIK